MKEGRNLEFGELPVLVVEPLLQLPLPLVDQRIRHIQLINVVLLPADASFSFKQRVLNDL
jgi:hypothetical protein